MGFPSSIMIMVTGVFAGMFGKLAGDSGLTGIPLLNFLGFSPNSAIATFFFGGTAMNITGWYGLHRNQMLNYRIGHLITIPSFAWAIIGPSIVLQFEEDILEKVIAILTLVTLLFLLLKPNTVSIMVHVKNQPSSL
jgi:uncharacterized membrane protein YfcA